MKFRLQASFPIIAAAIRPRRQILDYRDKVWPRTVANVKKVAAFETNPWRSSMAVLAEPTTEGVDDRLAKHNSLVLAVAQALAGANAGVIVATGGIAGAILAPDPALATLPISVMAVGMWAGTLPVGMLAKAFGRRFALQTGSVFGILSGIVSCLAMLQGSFLLLLLGTLCGGLYAAAHQSYRFAAADTASAHFRAKAVSWVLAGGIFAGVIGPQLVILTKDAWPAYLFAGTYLAQSACALLAASCWHS